VSFDNERDIFGNRSDSSHHSPSEGNRAGVLNTDSAEMGRWKVEEQRKRDGMFYHASSNTGTPHSGPYDFSPFTGKDISRPLGKCIIGFLALCVALGIAGAAYDSFHSWQVTGHREIINQRMQMYSDFSPVEKWPSEISRRYGAYRYKSISEVLREIPANTDGLSSDTKSEYGARIWFAVSSRGKDAHAYFNKAEMDNFRKKHKVVDSENLVVEFLHRQCQAGIAVACFDAAKVLAGRILWGGWYDTTLADQKALAELPVTGPNANSTEAKELRSRITHGPDLHGWDFLESLCRKFGFALS